MENYLGENRVFVPPSDGYPPGELGEIGGKG